MSASDGPTPKDVLRRVLFDDVDDWLYDDNGDAVDPDLLIDSIIAALAAAGLLVPEGAVVVRPEHFDAMVEAMARAGVGGFWRQIEWTHKDITLHCSSLLRAALAVPGEVPNA